MGWHASRVGDHTQDRTWGLNDGSWIVVQSLPWPTFCSRLSLMHPMVLFPCPGHPALGTLPQRSAWALGSTQYMQEAMWARAWAEPIGNRQNRHQWGSSRGRVGDARNPASWTPLGETGHRTWPRTHPKGSLWIGLEPGALGPCPEAAHHQPLSHWSTQVPGELLAPPLGFVKALKWTWT